MKQYIAKKNNSAFFLSKAEHIEESLDKGFQIYEVDEDGVETLIVTPNSRFDRSVPNLNTHSTIKLVR